MRSSKLSAFDAFFVAYQESSGVLMQLGVEVELKGRIARSDLEQVLQYIVRRWPPLGQTLQTGLLGLSWSGECRTREMLHVAESREALSAWRNKPLNPFREPPLQLLWIADGDTNLCAFRAHHAVVDGEGFFAICAEAVRELAEVCKERLLGVRRPAAALAFDHGIENRAAPGRRTPKRIATGDAVKVLQQLRKEAQSNQSARLAVRSCTPGDTAVLQRELDQNDFRKLQRTATELGVAPGWLCASAWMKAIHAWNVSRKADATSLISLEVPVSLRRRRDKELRIGNRISPLTLFGNATQPLEDLATHLKQQMAGALHQRLHLALPQLAAPAEFLPWPIFRKLAASPELTGFATSHFVWFEQSQAIHEEVLRASAGALEIVDQEMYAPVCLHMGAALGILAWPERAQIFLVHRLTAFDTADAQTLLDFMVEELGHEHMSRRQVAV